MLVIRKEQMDALELAFYRRQCIKFVGQELRLFDYVIPEQELQLLFEQFFPLIDIKSRNDRLTLVLLLLASVALQKIFTQQAITRFMSESMTPDDRRQRLQHEFLRHAGYDSEFLLRKTWI